MRNPNEARTATAKLTIILPFPRSKRDQRPEYKGEVVNLSQKVSPDISNLLAVPYCATAPLLGSTWNSTCVCCIEIWNPGLFPKAENHLCFSKKSFFFAIIRPRQGDVFWSICQTTLLSPIRDTSITQSKRGICCQMHQSSHIFVDVTLHNADWYCTHGAREINFHWSHLNSTYIPHSLFCKVETMLCKSPLFWFLTVGLAHINLNISSFFPAFANLADIYYYSEVVYKEHKPGSSKSFPILENPSWSTFRIHWFFGASSTQKQLGSYEYRIVIHRLGRCFAETDTHFSR